MPNLESADLSNRAMELAIVGLAGRFPGAANVDEFWQNLCNGVESISFFSDEEVVAAGVDPKEMNDPHYVKAGGVLEAAEDFDAGFFGIYPREAAIMDPQHRVFLEVAWEALENAGYTPDNYPGWIGLYGGVGMNTYLMFNLIPNREIMETVHGYQLTISNDKDFLPTRVSYKLNLRGPSVNVQTACSTSLVAVHLACQSLLTYQCDMALAGGVSIRHPQKSGYLYQEGGITSPDGHCRAFDARAAGTVSGNGAGVVVIKRLADAVKDGDTIRAIIKGSAINNDGSMKVGYTAPSVEGQAEVISMAQAIANVDPRTITYIETHGTGTALGDPIEIAALTQVFHAAAFSPDDSLLDSQSPINGENKYCAIGSVKTNVGHLDAAAGVTSLIKTTLALENRLIPPSLHFTKPNPKIDFENSPFYVNAQLSEWKVGEGDSKSQIPRRAGVSSFGIGGTNVHLILEEAAVLDAFNPAVDKVVQDANLGAPTNNDLSLDDVRPQIILLSARSTVSLEIATDNLVKHLQNHPDQSLQDVAYTLQVGRKVFSQRRLLVCQTISEAVEALSNRDPQKVFSSSRQEITRSASESTELTADGVYPFSLKDGHVQIAFMFSGQGAQYPNMARGLYETEAVFREHFDRCVDILIPYIGDLRQKIFIDEEGADKDHELDQTAFTQPALFVIEYSLAQLLISWGIVPQAMIGHSIGEYVAACLANVFSLEDALAVVAARGRLMQSLPPGAMISIPLSETEVRPYLRQGLSLAAVNAPGLCVVSGDLTAIDDLTYRLANDAIEFRRLRTSHAFHSEMMEPILVEFRRQFENRPLSTPSIPLISNVSGTWMTLEQASDPEYWTRHLRQTVRFSNGVTELLKDPSWLLLEVGPGQTLATLAKSVLNSWSLSPGPDIETNGRAERIILTTLRAPRSTQSDQIFILNNLGRLWLSGVQINWESFWETVKSGNQRRDDDERPKGPRRIPLPTYPFDRRRYWIEPDAPLRRLLRGESMHANLSADIQGARSGLQSTRSRGIFKQPNLRDWFYSPSWKRQELLHTLPETSINETDNNNWLVFADDVNPSADDLYRSWNGSIPLQISNLVWVTVGGRYQQVDENHFEIDPHRPEDYLTLLAELANQNRPLDYIVHLWGLSDDDERLHMAVLSLLFLVQAFDKLQMTREIQIGIATCGAFDVNGDEHLNPLSAAFFGLCKVITQEYPNLICRQMDVMLNSPFGQALDLRLQVQDIFRRLIIELLRKPLERFIAYRGNRRWTPVFERIDPTGSIIETWNSSISLQPRLLRQSGTYLITGGLGRIGLTLAEYLASKTQANLVLVDRYEPSSQRTERIKSLEALGARILTLQADVANLTEMEAAFSTAQQQFGQINGVIHAAGVVGDAAVKSLAETSSRQIETQFSPKVTGLQVLHQVLQRDWVNDLDFVFLQSSLSVVLGGLGLGAYSAANAVMDLLATQFDRQDDDKKHNNGNESRYGRKPLWIRVDWDGWNFTETENRRETTSATAMRDGPNLTELSMSPAEGVRIFETALIYASMGMGHLIVSTADLDSRLNQWVNLAGSEKADQAIAQTLGNNDGEISKVGDRLPDPNLYPRPDLQVAYVAPRNDLEAQIAETWQKVLGIGPIGVYDDFFELGGHSLLATQLATRLRDSLKVELPLRRLFESPTVAGLVAIINETMAMSSTALPVISRIPRDRDLELSFGQQRLWFIDQFDPGSPLYNNFAALKLSGHLDHEALVFCIRKIVDRHESLRTTFLETNQQAVQVIHDSMEIPLEVIDLQGLSTASSEAEISATITRLAVEEAKRPFDLTRGPLLRLVLVKTSPEEHIIFLTMHHIVSDGWSVGVLVREFAALYSAAISNQIPIKDNGLPELPIQYADYAAWQRQWLQGERLSTQLDYWREQLSGSGHLELFTDYPRPAVQTWRGASQWFELPEKLSREIITFSQREGVTSFMTLTAALQILLARYTGQDDISIGTPIANRTRAELEGLIGFILNTLVVRTDLSGNPSFRQALNRVRETALGAYAHQDLPFEMLVEELQPARDMSRAPFFQVIFDLQVAPLQALNLPDLAITPLQIDSGMAKFDLALSMEEGSKGDLKGYLNYNSDLFEGATIDRFLHHFITLLEGAIQDPDLLLSELPLLTPAEKLQIMGVWNPSPVAELSAPFIHDMLHQEARNFPTGPALSIVRKENNSSSNLYPSEIPYMSYQELDERSNRLANYLVRAGIKPDDLVGLCMDRSLEMIIGLYGILKAGGAFLPLDPAYPSERLKYMLEDSKTEVVLTQSAIVSRPEFADLFQHPVCVDRDWEFIEQENQLPPAIELSGDHLAYVIYTSGSTGKPKGVMITHTAVANHCRDMARHFGINRGDHVLQFASLSFDAGLEQVFTTLISGGWLFVRNDEVWPADEFHQNIVSLQLNVVNVPPAYWQPWVQYVFENNIPAPSLRLVIIGGDVMMLDSLNLWLQTPLKHVRLLNAYGPTETTITATTFQLPMADVLSPLVDSSSLNISLNEPSQLEKFLGGSHYPRIPIGAPHPNRKAYVLDRFGNLLPAGLPGELHLGGAYLAKGYLNQPELTKERFIGDQISPQSTSQDDLRLYRTGDLVRWLPNGILDIIGRVDQQVKLRGFRIELGEIESIIYSHPKIVDAVVVLHSDRLVAFVVAGDNSPLDTNAIFRFVSEKLPAYMVPSVFVQLDKIPLSPSGKIDRQALAEMNTLEPSASQRAKEVVAPRSPLEQEVMDLWIEVLGSVTPMSIDENFFELGGHSLLATRIVSRLRAAYQIELPLRQLFENPTIAGIASLIAQSLAETSYLTTANAETETPEAGDDLAELLSEIEGLSDDEVRRLLANAGTN